MFNLIQDLFLQLIVPVPIFESKDDVYRFWIFCTLPSTLRK
jgi:hypothetical protein